jgi:hypothetical protein
LCFKKIRVCFFTILFKQLKSTIGATPLNLKKRREKKEISGKQKGDLP